ncbi:GntR family transcriptional regulator [Erwinia sorbitola]|uniref:FCD domain-containing protein n=1 Tax=Erwinia sorbitola TaxID=2681984 RepID=A0ABW9RGI7_9GAMM|nr:GntR family transcriptional regulator [Erwinia sorbitola]MTD28634.1 FCD domain-containing protein [Erwinia sorbitola]
MSGAISARQQEVQRIIDALSMAIAQHRLKPGVRLVEAQIVEALSANRNHVQAALQRLALQHIVTIAPNRGAKVAQPTAREAREVFIARRAIERAMLAGISVDKMALHGDEIEAHLQGEGAAAASEDRRDIVRQLSQFHLLLAKISDNRVLTEMLSNLMVRSSLIVALYQRNDRPECQCQEHRAIIAALRAGNVTEAQTVMDDHLNFIEQQLELDVTPAAPVSLLDALSGW